LSWLNRLRAGHKTSARNCATAAIHQAFMNSSGHRANIMGKTWDVIGLGAYKSPTRKKMWTVLCADKCGTSGGTSTAPRRRRSWPKGRRRSRR
jgi:hypothetical protein